jgi:AdoMet-dependent heme synthase
VNLDLAPILVFWETTRACQLACRHCRASAIATPLPGELTSREGERLLDDIAGFGSRPPVLILTGGDVLMRQDLTTLVAGARDRGIPVGLSPSVTPLLTPAALAPLRELGVRSVSVSLDGARAATHEAIRGVDGHFRATIDALRMLVDEGFTVQVNTTVMLDNVEELADVAGLLVDVGVRIWEVFFLVQVGRGAEVRDLSPAQNEDVAHFLYDASRYGLTVRTVEGPFFRRVTRWRQEAAAAAADPAHADGTDRFARGALHARLTDRLRALLGPPSGPARAQTAGTRDGRGIVFVAHDGAILPSGFLPLELGNVREHDLVAVYRDHPLLRAIRAARFGGRCGRCDDRELCGGSRARAYAHGDVLGEDPACAYQPPASPTDRPPRSGAPGRHEVPCPTVASGWSRSSSP